MKSQVNHKYSGNYILKHILYVLGCITAVCAIDIIFFVAMAGSVSFFVHHIFGA